MSTSWYEPQEAQEGNYTAPPCKGGYLNDVKVQPPDLTQQFARVIYLLEQNDVPGACFTLGLISGECSVMPVAQDVECNFDGGSVDASFCGGRTSFTVTWTCPVCGTEQSEDREVGDDHPDL